MAKEPSLSSKFTIHNRHSGTPYKNGAVESVRSEVFYQALQDMRAMKLLGEMTGKDNAVACIEKEFGKITFSQYPRKTESILRLREIVNKAIERKSI